MDLIETLANLSIDPYAQDAFAHAPQDYLHAAGLALDTQAALARRDWHTLETTLNSGPWARCAACGDPGPDPLPDMHPAIPEA